MFPFTVKYDIQQVTLKGGASLPYKGVHNVLWFRDAKLLNPRLYEKI